MLCRRSGSTSIRRCRYSTARPSLLIGGSLRREHCRRVRLQRKGRGVELDDLRHPDAERLAEYAEGVLTDEARVEVEDHLGRCADCRAVVMETTAFLTAMPEARNAGRSTGVVPARPRHRWVSIAAGLAAA